MMKVKNHIIGFILGVAVTTSFTVFAANNPGTIGSLFQDIGGGVYKLLGSNIKDGTVGSGQVNFNYAGSASKGGPATSAVTADTAKAVDFNGGLTTTSSPTFSSIISTNKSEFGKTATDYVPATGNWNYTLQLNGKDTTSIGFHDAGNSVSSIKYNGVNGFTIGGNDGWGVASVSFPGGIKFADGSIQTTSATRGAPIVAPEKVHGVVDGGSGWNDDCPSGYAMTGIGVYGNRMYLRCTKF